MYAKTKNRRQQWMELINDISTQLSTSAMYGKLFKQGGMRHNTWQERWCICSGSSLDYFEQATDNQAKGSIGKASCLCAKLCSAFFSLMKLMNLVVFFFFLFSPADLMNATVKEMDVKGKFCFEITPAANGYAKKGKNKDKSYVFQVEKEHDRERWIESIRRASAHRANQTMEVGENGEPIAGGGQPNNNPLHEQGQGQGQSGGAPRKESMASEGDEDEEGSTTSGVRSMSSSIFRASQMVATDKEGYLLKKSPALLKGWQKRYFLTNSTGDIDYYKTVRV